MFDGIPFITYTYNDMQMEQTSGPEVEISEDDFREQSETYLKNCEFVFDLVCHVCRSSKTWTSDNAPVIMENIAFLEAGPKYYTRRSELSSYLIKYTLDGEGILEYGGKKYELKPNSGFFIDCTQPHTYYTKTAVWKHLDIHVNGSYVQTMYEHFLDGGSALFQPDSSADFLKQIERIFLAESSVNQYRDSIISGIVSQLLVDILTSTEHYKSDTSYTSSQLRYLVQYIENHFTEDLSLDFLASFASMSKYHMCRVFRKYMRCTIVEYITKLRMERACYLLRNTTLNANQVGYVVGIADENYFYRIFKKHIGISPKEYAKTKSRSF